MKIICSLIYNNKNNTKKILHPLMVDKSYKIKLVEEKEGDRQPKAGCSLNSVRLIKKNNKLSREN